VDGLLFDFPDAGSLAQQIVRLLEEPGLRDRLGAAGRRKVAERFTWQRIAAETRSAYARVIAGQAAVKQEG
jgi:glycosyltransferase involved in cell wall biosynthesis